MTAKRIFTSVFLNWIAMAIGMVVAFFLSPYVVHHLGNVAFGVWTVIVSTTGYMSLLDLGLRGAVTRYVSGDAAKGDHLHASRIVSAALVIRLALSGLTILLSAALASVLPRLFHISSPIQTPARYAMLLTGCSLACTLTFSVFSAVLAARHRFDLISTMAVAQVFARAGGVVYLLHSGHGILALAMWELAVNIVIQLGLVKLCFWAYPYLRLRREVPTRELMSKLARYSIYAFIINVGQQAIYYTDNLVVGALLSMTAVTLYAIGGGLIEYVRQVVSALSTTFVPLASRFEAEGKSSDLHSLLINGTRASLCVSLAIGVALFFRGHTFIGLWMGQQYAGVSGRVLQILLISTILNCGNSVSGNIVYGLGAHRRVAIWVVCEAACNFALSVILVKRLGLYGVAWGTVVPSVFVSVVLWPRYISRLLGASMWAYLWQSWGRSVLAAIPFAVVCHYMDIFFHPTRLSQFIAQMGATLPVFILSAVVVFRAEIAYQMKLRYGRIQSARVFQQ